MAFNQAPSPEKLENLLDWLDADRERASSRYLSVRTALEKIFESRGCADADQLADLTIDRVMEKAENIAKGFEGDPARYFYGVAKNVLHEHFRRRPTVEFMESFTVAVDEADDRSEARAECLDRCILELEPYDAGLITSYYRYDQHDKASSRLRVAEKHKMTLANLRIRAYRIRKKLRECMETCFENRLVD